MTAAPQLARLKRAFPRQEVTAGTFQAYCEDLDPIPDGLLDAAVSDLIRTSQWFPTIAEIRTRAAEILLALPSDADAGEQLRARIAWRDDGPKPILHPLVRLAVEEMGGLASYRQTTSPDQWRAGFARTYRTLAAAQIANAARSPALGG